MLIKKCHLIPGGILTSGPSVAALFCLILLEQQRASGEEIDEGKGFRAAVEEEAALSSASAAVLTLTKEPFALPGAKTKRSEREEREVGRCGCI